jgi:hypothetical protein
MAAIPFFSADWAEAARTEINAGPDPATVERKVAGFWDWIERARANVNCTLVLAVRDLPDGRPDAIVLDLEHGACIGVRLTTRTDAEARCTYLVAGDCAAWREVMDGYDMGRSIMYRKLLLERGDVLVFFRTVYYWTETLACLQRIPTAFPGVTAGQLLSADE